MQQAKLKHLTSEELDQLAINTIRTLSIDAVQQAKSGHPGTPMALAPLVYTIWNRVLGFDPQDPIWPNRDPLRSVKRSCLDAAVVRVVSERGLRAVGARYERLGEPAVTLDGIHHFRQLGSKAPGHPEYHLVPPASEASDRSARSGHRHQRRHGDCAEMAWQPLQQPGFALFDYNIYAICGDGDAMEGVGSEGGFARQPSTPSTICAGFTTTITSRSTARPRSPLPRMLPRATLPIIGMCCKVGDANDLESIEGHSRSSARRKTGRP